MQNLLLFKIQSKTHRYTSFSRHKSDAFLTICLHHFSILLMRYVKKVETRWMKLPFEVRSWRGERTGRKAKEDPFLPSLTPYKLEYNNFTNYHSLWSIFFYEIITHIHVMISSKTPQFLLKETSLKSWRICVRVCDYLIKENWSY